MALIDRGWFMTMTVVDKQNDAVTITRMLQAADAVAAVADRDAYIAAWGGVSDAKILRHNLYNKTSENLPSAATDGDNSSKARVSLYKDNGDRTTIDITAPKEAIFEGLAGKANNIVDVQNAALLAYFATYQNGNSVHVSDGENLAATPPIEGIRATVARGK